MSSAAYPSLRRASLVLTLLLTLSSIIPSTSADLGTIKLKSRQHRSPRHPLLRRSVVSESLTDYYNGTDLQVATPLEYQIGLRLKFHSGMVT